MGKKSLIKSTTKKKTASPQKSASKQPETNAKTTKPAEKKATTAKKPAASAAPSKPAQKNLSVSELLKLSFGIWSPDKLYVPPTDATGPTNYTAPPFFDGTPQETETVKTLLARQFDLTAPPAAPEAPAAEAIPAVSADKESKTAAEAPAAAGGARPATEQILKTPEIPPTDETPAAAKDTAPAETATAAAPAPDSEPPAEPEPFIPAGPACVELPDNGEPPNNVLRMLIGCLVLIFVILLIASVLNSSNYYLKPTAAGLEIWRGKFSPTGNTLVETVPNVALSVPVESIYNRDQAMTVVYDYYMKRTAERSTVIGEPDFAAVVALYEQAKKYAPTPAQADIADSRLKTITAQSLISAADKAIVKTTPQNIDKALALLHEAAGLATERTQQQLIRVKIDELTAIKAEKPEKETPTARKKTPDAAK